MPVSLPPGPEAALTPTHHPRPAVPVPPSAPSDKRRNATRLATACHVPGKARTTAILPPEATTEVLGGHLAHLHTPGDAKRTEESATSAHREHGASFTWWAGTPEGPPISSESSQVPAPKVPTTVLPGLWP